jgi:hypothetical protein
VAGDRLPAANAEVPEPDEVVRVRTPAISAARRGADAGGVPAAEHHPEEIPVDRGAMPRSAAGPATPMVYVDCDVPDGMTLSEWRRHRREPAVARRSRRLTVRRLTRRLGG